MGWAAHNPEAYDELERNAARRWLTGLCIETENTAPDEDTIVGLVNTLQGEQPAVFRAIMDAGADKEVDEMEYFEKFIP